MSDGQHELRRPNSMEGRYANYFKVGHNHLEFLIDFGQYYPDNGAEQFHTRIITSPIYAKALFETLRESIVQYEEVYGSLSKPSRDL